MDWHCLSTEEAAKQLDSDLQRGLTTSFASTRLEQIGPNALQETRKRHPSAMLA